MRVSRFGFRFCLLIITASLFVACKKDEDAEPETETPATSSGSFSWTLPFGNVNADSAYYYSQITTIYAFKNGLSQSLEINLSSLSAGTYSLSSSTGNVLTYVTGATTYTASSGTFNISSTTGGRLSGSFNAALSGGPLSQISGSFTELRQK